jgi:FSR family fosmidomycin resistance protein-like MFS transporter
MELGLIVNCVGMSFVGIAPTYTVILFLVGTAGLGCAAFHPVAFCRVVETSDKSRGGRLGVFLSTGNTGSFLAPMVGGLMVSAVGMSGTLLLLPVGITLTLLLLGYRSAAGNMVRISPHQKTNRRLVAILSVITALRSIAVQPIIAFLPLYFVAKGNTLFFATAVASLWLGLALTGQVVGGRISDRVGRRPVILTSLFLGSALFYGFLATSGLLSLLFLTFSGAVMYAGWSVIVAMSSEAAPSSVGAVSGVMLGFAIGVGGLATAVFGGLADVIGLEAAFYISTAFAVAAGLFSLVLPKQET